MGPSGAGKSTLLGIMGMLDAGWTGLLRLCGPSGSTSSSRTAGRAQTGTFIGFVFQQYHLIDDLTVYENIETPLSYRDVPKAERQAMVADILDRFQIVAKKDLYPNQLSGGQQQLVGVAARVVAKPKLILADEPPAISTPRRHARSWSCSAGSTARGPRSFRCTHSEENAKFSKAIVQVKDGWMVRE
jgi:ABC-type lipoprotein export system ATPase subunit